MIADVRLTGLNGYLSLIYYVERKSKNQLVNFVIIMLMINLEVILYGLYGTVFIILHLIERINLWRTF